MTPSERAKAALQKPGVFYYQPGQQLHYQEWCVEHLEEVVAAVIAEAEADKDAEILRLRAQIQGHCERIAAQSEILSRRAQRQPV